MNTLIENGLAFFQDRNSVARVVGLAMGSLLVLGAAGGLCLGLRHASAATRHWVWCVAMAGLLCLPWW